MPRSLRWTTLLLLAAVALGLVWRFHHRLFAPKPMALPAAPMASGGMKEPQLMLWAWETPEDLTELDPAKAGVAFLSREVLLGVGDRGVSDATKIQVRPRLQPLRTAPGAFLMADVRIEIAPRFVAAQASQQFIADTADAVVAGARGPSVRALQIDFDATASQRGFYVALLKQVRAKLPANIPLSMTALVSWCAKPSWLDQLPARTVDEAVPMYFRMGGPVSSRATAPKVWNVTEPLCAASVGLATDETWPAISPGQRVYVFQPGPWRATDIAKLNANVAKKNIKGYQGLR